MKRKFLVLLCIAALLVFSFSACDLLGGDDDTDDTCEHTFSESWSKNSTQHWHAATCEHSEEKSELNNHTDADEDGLCDVCEYNVGHEHTYEETWLSDETHHWHKATCTHTTDKGAYAEHVDSNANGVCDVCDREVTFCVEPSELDKVIAALVERAGAVSGGFISYNNTNTSIDGTSSVLKYNIDYLFGSDSAYYKQYDSSYTIEKWQQKLGQDDYFGVVLENGELSLDSAADASTFAGAYFTFSTLADAYGPENSLSVLYDLTKGTGSSNFVFNYDEQTGVYTFSFDYLVINRGTAEGKAADFYKVTVSFTHTENYVLSTLDVVCEAYTNSLADSADHDFSFDPETETITMYPTAIADTYTYNVTQTVGERTFVNEHTKDKYIPTDFDLFTDDLRTDKIDGSMEATAGEVTYVYLGAFIPEGTSVSLVANQFSATLDGDYNIFALPMDNALLFNITDVGTYTLTVTVLDVTKTVTVTVKEPVIIPDDPQDQPENTVKVVITDMYSWNNLATFTAPADGDYTFIIAEGVLLGACDVDAADDGIIIQGKAPWADFNITDDYGVIIGGSRTASLKAGETFEFYVCSPEKGTFYIPYTAEDYTGTSIPGIDNSAINGRWQYVYGTTVYFDFLFEDGVITVIYAAEGNLAEKYEYTYNALTNVLTVDGTSDFSVNADGKVVYGVYGALTKAPDELNLAIGANNEISGKNVNLNFTADVNGTLSLIIGTALGGDVSITYSINGETPIALALGTAKDLTLKAGDKLVIYVVATGNSSISTTFTEISDTPTVPSGSKELAIGTNSIDASNVTYAYKAGESGYLTLSAGAAINGDVTIYYSVNNGEKLTLALNSSVTLGIKSGDVVVITVSATGYSSIKAEWENSSGDPVVEPDGSEENPFIIDGAGDTLNVFAGYGSYIYVKVTGGLTVTLDCAAHFCDAEGNILGATVTASTTTVYGITSDGMAAAMGTLSASWQEGSDGSHPLVMGDTTLSASTPSIKFEATEDGYLTLVLGNPVADSLSVSFTVNGEHTIGFPSNTSLVLPVKAGDVLLFTVSTEAGKVDLFASFEAGEVTVITDTTTPSGTGTEVDPYVITESGYYNVGAVNSYPGIFFTITADKNVTVTLSNDFPFIYNTSYTLRSEWYSNYAFTLEAGESITLCLCMDSGKVSSSILGVKIEDASGEEDTEEYETYVSSDTYLTVKLGTETVIFEWSHPMQGSSTATYTYKVVNGTVILYDEDGNNVVAPLAELTLTDGAPTAAVFNYQTFTF